MDTKAKYILIKEDALEYAVCIMVAILFKPQYIIMHHLKAEALLTLLLCSLWYVQMIGCTMVGRSDSSVITQIKCLSGIFCWLCVSIDFIHYIGPSVFGLYFVDCENIRTSYYYHHEIKKMNYEPPSSIKSWNNGMRCMSCCFLIHGNSVMYFYVSYFGPAPNKHRPPVYR